MIAAIAAFAARIGLPAVGRYLAAHWRWLLPSLVTVGLGLALLFARADARHWRKVADNRAKIIKSNADKYRAAQEAAMRKAEHDRAAHETETRTLAERIDDANDHAQAAARDAVAAYARTHRVPGLVRNPGAPSGPATAAVPDDPARSPRAGEAPDMVAVSEAELGDLSKAALQAAIAREWAEQLIAKGYAVPAAKPTQ